MALFVTHNQMCTELLGNDSVIREVQKDTQWLSIDSSQIYVAISSFKQEGFEHGTVSRIATCE